MADYAEQFASWNLLISLCAFVLGLEPGLRLQHGRLVARGPARARQPVARLTLEWQVSSPPPIFNFDRVPTVVGGPYEYGVPDAVHGIFEPAEEAPAETRPAGATSFLREERAE